MNCYCVVSVKKNFSEYLNLYYFRDVSISDSEQSEEVNGSKTMCVVFVVLPSLSVYTLKMTVKFSIFIDKKRFS